MKILCVRTAQPHKTLSCVENIYTHCEKDTSVFCFILSFTDIQIAWTDLKYIFQICRFWGKAFENIKERIPNKQKLRERTQFVHKPELLIWPREVYVIVAFGCMVFAFFYGNRGKEIVTIWLGGSFCLILTKSYYLNHNLAKHAPKLVRGTKGKLSNYSSILP